MSDPKGEAGKLKAPLWLIPPVAMDAAAWAHSQGVVKYGAYNWRHGSVCASTYTSAAMRHFNQWRSGEDIDTESGYHHLGHVIANLNILLDAQHHGTLKDDRPTP